MNKKLKAYLPEFVYGGIDGTVTTFAVIAGSIGASLSPAIILILGFANLFADGFSMAASNYLSRKSEEDSLNRKSPLSTAFATFASFVVVGFIPLAPFVIAPLSFFLESNKFVIAFIATAATFISIGWIKGIVTGRGKGKAASETFLIGSCAALIAYLIGIFIRSILE